MSDIHLFKQDNLGSLFPCQFKGCKENATREMFLTQQPDITRIVCDKHCDAACIQGFWQETEESRG